MRFCVYCIGNKRGLLVPHTTNDQGNFFSSFSGIMTHLTWIEIVDIDRDSRFFDVYILCKFFEASAHMFHFCL